MTKPPTTPGSNLPAQPAKGKGTFLDKVRAGKAVQAGDKPLPASKRDLVSMAVERLPPRLVFAIDATASRQPTWNKTKPMTVALFDALPGQLEVNLAVHGGSQVHTWTPFSSEHAVFKAEAEKVQCVGGWTQLVPMMQQAATTPRVRTMLYVGDAFEESLADAEAAAAALRAKGCKMVILQDNPTPEAAEAFQRIAEITGGAVIDLHKAKGKAMGEIMQAVAVMAVEGPEGLKKAKALPGAALLLSHLKGG